jgi:two-component system, OmpR family, response regulator VicR
VTRGDSGAGTVLIVDDEADIRDVLEFVLQNAGYHTESTGRGDDALRIVQRRRPDLVILDIGLPGLSGLDVCPQLTAMAIPVLVLSSHDRDDQVVTGLEVGAEDYVTKPFNHRELLLRVEKIIRRTRPAYPEGVLRVGALRIDRDRREVTVDGRAVPLTPTEFDLITWLARTPGVPVPVETLLRDVWHVTEWTSGDEMVKVSIRRLRRKIEPDPKNPRYLLNRWGQGYFLTES